MRLSAKPSLNGNTERDFQDAYMALSDAKDEAEKAFRTLLADVANGRNYQHLADADAAIIADRRRIHADLMAISGTIGALQSALADILEA